MAGARILLLHRREDFLSGEWPADMQAEAVRLKQQVDDALADISRRLFGSGDARLLRIATLAILDVAFAAVRRHVAANEVPPAYVDDLVRSAYAALIPSARGRMPTEQGEQPMDATQTSTETPFGEADRQLNAMIAAGRAREAFEQFLDDDVVMQENADPPTRGKQANRRREAPFFEAVAKLEATLLGSATANDTSYSEWRYVVDFKDGSRWDFYQVAARRWKGAKVIHERYYHPHFPTRSQLA